MSGIGDGRLILIVEDNERNAKLARDVLQFHGFRTVETVSGEEGVILHLKAKRTGLMLSLGGDAVVITMQ